MIRRYLVGRELPTNSVWRSALLQAQDGESDITTGMNILVATFQGDNSMQFDVCLYRTPNLTLTASAAPAESVSIAASAEKVVTKFEGITRAKEITDAHLNVLLNLPPKQTP